MPEDDEDERFDRLLEALEIAVELCTRNDRIRHLPEIARSCREALAVVDKDPRGQLPTAGGERSGSNRSTLPPNCADLLRPSILKLANDAEALARRAEASTDWPTIVALIAVGNDIAALASAMGVILRRSDISSADERYPNGL